MSELIQPRTVVDMIVNKKKCSEAYARLIIINARKSGKLRPYQKTLKYGTRSMYLYDPNEVNIWLDSLKYRK